MDGSLETSEETGSHVLLAGELGTCKNGKKNKPGKEGR